MANPFEKRATEYLRDDEAGFLSLVSPEPVRTYLEAGNEKGQLFEMLVRILGSPGSGKTTMATLLEARMVETVLVEREKEGHAEIIDALEACGVIENGELAVAAVRLPMEGEYRDFWELPYDETLRTKLALALIQSRAILGLVRNLEKRHPKNAISFVIRADASAALEEIGGSGTDDIVERARSVERAVYQVGASLIPPAQAQIPKAAVRPFRPFDVIESVQVRGRNGVVSTLKPLVILDDAHNLAPRQFDLVFRDLARREIRMARWIMMRRDSLTPEAALLASDGPIAPEVKASRDYVDIYLQKPGDRATRSAFRTVAKSMADRYLRRHPVFERRQWRSFSTLLSVEPPALSSKALARLADDVAKTQARLGITVARRDALEAEVARYATGANSQDVGPDVQLAMLRILMNRYVNQVPQQSLFGAESDPEPRHALTADSGVSRGARLFLRHNYNRPLHYGLSAIADASSENAELFLHLAGSLVDRMEARIINGSTPSLSAQQQDKILSDRAKLIMDKWNFPFATGIRSMLAAMAKDCLGESLSPSAWLDAGANAIGVPQDEFTAAVKNKQNDLAQFLHYAVAYNAVLIRPKYRQGGKEWCLIELGGPAILANSLTLSRGGFLERRVVDLLRYAGLRA